MNLHLILCMVKSELTDGIVDSAKSVGATGATIINASGVGIHEAKTFFGLSLSAQTDVVLFLVEKHLVDTILKEIYKTGKFNEPGTGIAFCLPVEQAIGLESQMEVMKQNIEKKD